MSNSKNLKAILAGMMLVGSQSVDCKLTEENLITQFIKIDDGGKGTLSRIYIDRSDLEHVKRCRIEYDINEVQPRNNYFLMFFGPARYYVDQ